MIALTQKSKNKETNDCLNQTEQDRNQAVWSRIQLPTSIIHLLNVAQFSLDRLEAVCCGWILAWGKKETKLLQ